MQQIPMPYLLFLGDVMDPLAAKTARGIYVWRPESCVGQIRLATDSVSLGLPDLDIPTAKAQGAKTMVLGTANSGGKLPKHWIDSIKTAIRAGLNVANGLHQGLNDIPELVELAAEHTGQLFDVRHMRPELDTGTGIKRSGKRILTVGTDCSSGKKYTALALEREPGGQPRAVADVHVRLSVLAPLAAPHLELSVLRAVIGEVERARLLASDAARVEHDQESHVAPRARFGLARCSA